MRRLLHSSWISLLALLLLVFGAIYYLGWTEAGLQRLVSLVNGRLGPVTLSLSGAHGTLHGGVHLDRAHGDQYPTAHQGPVHFRAGTRAG